MDQLTSTLLDALLATVDAKELIRLVAKENPELVGNAIVLLVSDKEFYNEISEIVTAGGKIEAIKQYRNLSGKGLKEAKDWVEYHFADAIKFYNDHKPTYMNNDDYRRWD